MRLADDLRRSVLFVGYKGATLDAPFEARGTAFQIYYDGCTYLVTANHVARHLAEDPFFIRVNITGGGAHALRVDPLMDKIRWYEHPDEDVDLAVMEFNYALRDEGFDSLIIPEGEVLATESRMRAADIGPGDFCYAVGLYSIMSGLRRNIPVVHTGNIALLPGDERVLVEDWRAPVGSGKTRLVDGYLVEMQTLEGLSGAPVFVRPSSELYADAPQRLRTPWDPVLLLGVWSTSWKVEGMVVAGAHGKKPRASIGMGVVVPAQKLEELFECREVREQRAEWAKKVEFHTAAKSD